MKPQKTWIVIADGERARVLECSGVGEPFVPVTRETLHDDNPPTHLQGTERPGRVHESVGTTRHAIQPRVDFHRAQKAEFAHTIAQMLEDAAQTHVYQRLVLVAPPRMMGDLRAALGTHARALVADELSHDLTHFSDKEIEARVRQDTSLRL